MSTIPVDPFDETKPETYPAIPTTADQRGQHAAGNAAFAAAKTDVEALESGKLDASAFAAHQGAGGAEHADATGSASGFMSAADKTKLDAVNEAAQGTYNEVQKDSTGQSANRAAIDFRDTGDATVVVTDDPANDRTIVTIDATAGAGGGGIGKGTPFVTGDLLEVESDAGDGAARSTGIASASVSGHIASTSNPHSVTAAQAGADPTGTAAAAVAAHEAAADPHTQYLEHVVEDTTPELGGDLSTAGNNIVLRNDAGGVEGILGASETFLGSAFIYSADGLYDESNGGLTVEPGRASLYGAAVTLPALKHGLSEGRDLRISQDGVVYAADLPTPGWTVNDTDSGNYDLGTGTGTGAWVELTGLDVTFPQTVEIGERLDVSVILYTVNDSGNHSGNIDIAFGLEATPPGAGDDDVTGVVSPGFAGNLPLSFSFVAAQQYTSGTIVTLYARIANGTGGSFGVELLGSISPHEFTLSTPGESGGGGTGDVVGPGSSVLGNLASYGDTTGKLIADSGVASADVSTMASAAAGAGNVIQSAGADKTQSDAGVAVTALARTDQPTTFTDIVTVHAPGNSGFIFHSDTSAVAARFLPGLGTVGQRDYDIAVVDGDFSILAIEDDIGTNPTNRFSIEWTGDVSIPTANFDVLNGESKQEGITLRRPVASVRTGANIRLSSARGVGELVDITEAGNFDLQPPLNSEARDSEWTILIRNNVTVNTPIGGADGDWDIVIGTDPGGANRIAYAIQMADATSILSWVQTS